MTSGGVFGRLMRSSVDRALDMQPKRTQRVADDLLYASPSAREEVASIRSAGARLVECGMLLPSVGSIAVRRGDGRATVTIAGSDLSSLDNRSLESVELSDRRTPAMAGLRAGGRAAIHAFPPYVLVLAGQGWSWDDAVSDLVDIVGSVEYADDVDGVRTGLTVIAGRGVVATHDDPLAVARRLEAAELLARITIIKQQTRRDHG